jgi:putative membrane protein
MRILLRIIINAIAIWLTSIILSSQMELSGGVWGLFIVALIFGLVNAFIRPIVEFFSLPITFLTLGLFGLVINAGMLLLTAGMTEYLDFTGRAIGEFGWAIIAGIIITLISGLVSWLLPD